MLAVLIVFSDQRPDHVVDSFRMQQLDQRLFGARGVPERKNGVILEVSSSVILMVHATIFAINIVEKGGRQTGQIEVGVKGGADMRITGFKINQMEYFSPCGNCRGMDFLKIPPGNFR